MGVPAAVVSSSRQGDPERPLWETARAAHGLHGASPETANQGGCVQLLPGGPMAGERSIWSWSWYLYLGTMGTLIIAQFLQPPTELSGGWLLVGIYVAATLSFSGILLFGWHPDADYPHSRHRVHAFWLWAYATAPAVLNATYFYRWGTSPAVSGLIYVLTFLFFTTLTFGDLPLYGGAGKEALNLSMRRNRLSSEYPFDGRVIEGVEVCVVCLTALVPEDQYCWRCASPVRFGVPVRNWLGRPRTV